MSTKRTSIVALVLGAMAGVACHTAPRRDARTPVARVGDVPIYLDAWQRELRWARSENLGALGPHRLPETGAEAHGRAILDDLIDRQLLTRQADHHHLTVSQDEIDAALTRLQSGWVPQTFAETIAHEDMSVAELRALLREKLLIRKYMRDFVFARLAVTDAQIETYAAAHPDVLHRPEQVRLAQIVVKDDAGGKKVAAALRQGKTFAEVAKEESLAPEARRGGDLGWVQRNVLPEAFERVCFALPVHTLSPMVPGPGGFHLFWVNEHAMPQDFSLAQMRNEVQSLLRRAAEAEAQATHLASLRRDTPIIVEEQRLVESYE